MGLIIYLAGDERFSSKRARFLHHEATTYVYGRLSDIKDDLKETYIVENMCNKIVEEATGKSDKWWQKKILKKEYWMGYLEARKLNIVTNEYYRVLMIRVVGWVGAALLAVCGAPEAYNAIILEKCTIGYPLLVMWLFGEILSLIFIVFQSSKVNLKPLLFNFGFNILFIVIMLFYKI